MATESNHTVPRSRRALLAGALGGLAAWAASTAARVNPVDAAAGDPIRMGRTNLAGGTQTVLQSDGGGSVFVVKQLGGAAGIQAQATTGRAVIGLAQNNGTGVWAESTNHVGVRARVGGLGTAVMAENLAGSGRGLFAYSFHGSAIVADSGSGRAALFKKRIEMWQHLAIRGITDPGPAPTGYASVFARDNGSGKTQLCVRFATGAIQVIATEP